MTVLIVLLITSLSYIGIAFLVNEGSIFFEGTPENAIEDDKIKKFYLGSEFKL